MQNNNYLSLINFKIKLHHQRLFFITEYDIGGSNFFERCKHGVSWVLERHVVCCKYGAMWGV